jgi:hypothetical protein
VTWNRLTNGQRAELVKLPVWTTEEDRLLALSYAHRHLGGVEEVLAAVRSARPAPLNYLGELVAVARYEDAGWTPDGCLEQWRRWIFTGKIERLSAAELVTWLGNVERTKHLKCSNKDNK